MNILITFSGYQYHDTTKRIVEDAPKFGADKVLVYDDHWLRSRRPFHILESQALMSRPEVKGVNWFAFKPFVVIDALNRCKDGDVVLYTDGDTYPVADLTPLFEVGRRDGLMLFWAVGHTQRMWCKRDCSITMGQDEEHWLDRKHGCARFMAFTRRQFPFLVEWYNYCLDLRCNTFEPSVLGLERPGFIQHRCEQAIMTNLAHKYGHKLWREACQFGNPVTEDLDIYPQVFCQDGAHSYATEDFGHWSNFENIPD